LDEGVAQGGGEGGRADQEEDQLAEAFEEHAPAGGLFGLVGLFERGDAGVDALHLVSDALEGVKDGLLIAIGGLDEALDGVVEDVDFGFDGGNFLARWFP
jgi:hypothetical protein